MEEKQLLEISYERIKSSEEVTLDVDNCAKHGCVATTIKINDKDYTVFYKADDPDKKILDYDFNENDETVTIIPDNVYQEYHHIAPPCSNYKINFADVDKEGSGRNSLTGEMFRERIGRYYSIDLTWDLIPNSVEYNRWYKILTHLPPKFKAKSLMPSGEIVEKEYYRTDVSTSLYLWTDGKQIWQGLSTSFVEWNVEEYDDTIEPELPEVPREE